MVEERRVNRYCVRVRLWFFVYSSGKRYSKETSRTDRNSRLHATDPFGEASRSFVHLFFFFKEKVSPSSFGTLRRVPGTVENGPKR